MTREKLLNTKKFNQSLTECFERQYEIGFKFLCPRKSRPTLNVHVSRRYTAKCYCGRQNNGRKVNGECAKRNQNARRPVLTKINVKTLEKKTKNYIIYGRCRLQKSKMCIASTWVRFTKFYKKKKRFVKF